MYQHLSQLPMSTVGFADGKKGCRFGSSLGLLSRGCGLPFMDSRSTYRALLFGLSFLHDGHMVGILPVLDVRLNDLPHLRQLSTSDMPNHLGVSANWSVDVPCKHLAAKKVNRSAPSHAAVECEVGQRGVLSSHSDARPCVDFLSV